MGSASLAFLPAPDEYEHGTRARYNAAKCRCDDCRNANTKYERDRQERKRAIAAELVPMRTESIEQEWTAPDGSKRMRRYARACIGVNGAPCPTSSHLRRDSTGDICGGCRLKLAPNGPVAAAAARAHLLELSALGIGRDAVAAACDVGVTTLAQIRAGVKQQIRGDTARRILAVDAGAIADGATVDAGEPWKRLRELLGLGFTKTEIARHIGSQSKTPALQLARGRVLAKTEQRVAKVHRELVRAHGRGSSWVITINAVSEVELDRKAFAIIRARRSDRG